MAPATAITRLDHDEARAEGNGETVGGNLRPGRRLPGMHAEQAERLAESASQPDMQAEAHGNRNAAQHRQPELNAMVALFGAPVHRIVRPPFGRGHAGFADGLPDVLGGDANGLLEHHHAAIQHIEREAVVTADDGTDRPTQGRHLLDAIEPPDLEDMAIAAIRRRRRRGRAAARVRMVMRTIVVMAARCFLAHPMPPASLISRNSPLSGAFRLAAGRCMADHKSYSD
jgi:hypothetical protein